jgi:hypothetical protein
MAAWFEDDLARTRADRNGHWFLYKKYTFYLYSEHQLMDLKYLILRQILGLASPRGLPFFNEFNALIEKWGTFLSCVFPGFAG